MYEESGYLLAPIQALPPLSEYGWLAAFAAAFFAFLALIIPLKKSVKYWMRPKLRARFTYPNRDEDSVLEYQRKAVERDYVIVPSGEFSRLGIGIESKWIYTPTMVEVSGDGEFPINQDHIFTEDDRPWEKPYPASDLHGNYKAQIEGLRLSSDDTLVIDIQLPEPLEPGEEKRLTVSVWVEEAKNPFNQTLWVRGSG